MLTLTNCSYLLELEARVNVYERVQDRDGTVDYLPESIDGESTTTPDLADPKRLLPSSLGPDTDEIDSNPLTEGIAQLVNNPDGERRMPLTSSQDHY